MSTDWISYMREHRPAITREEIAVAAGISIATLTRRLREGLDADEVIRAARSVGASPTDALLSLGMLTADDLRAIAAVDAIDTVPETVLLEELLERARSREAAEAADRQDAGLPPAPPARFVPRIVEPQLPDLDELAARHGNHDEGDDSHD